MPRCHSLEPHDPRWRRFRACRVCAARDGQPCWALYATRLESTGTVTTWKPRGAGTYCRQPHPGRRVWNPQRGVRREE